MSDETAAASTAATIDTRVIKPAPPAAGLPASGLSDTFGLLAGVGFCLAYVVLVTALAPFLKPIAFSPDAGGFYYYWQLPDPSTFTRSIAWGGYLLHQLTIWALIYRAQNQA